ncbi:MAG: hypothetical protein RLZZ32_2241 [Cyanobacteriota bacterium]
MRLNPHLNRRRRRVRRRLLQQAPAPWLTSGKLQLAELLLQSHQLAFGKALAAAPQELFSSDLVVLAHDGSADPCLTYANAAALRLWERPWNAMVGMPSRLTAEQHERSSRAQALQQALAQQSIEGYSGIRISSSGRRFQIHNARLWTLLRADGSPCGQAAAFSDWWWL